MTADRLLVLADPVAPAAELLVGAVLGAASGRLEVAAVCDAGTVPAPPPLRRAARRVALELARRTFERRGACALRELPAPLERLCRRGRIPFLVPPGRDVSSPAFLDMVDGLRANLLLSVVCGQVLRRPLLERLEMAVNYHPGLLPGYRGMRPTAWSVYNDEPETGFAFHRIDEGIDTGAVLLEGVLPVAPGVAGAALEWRKSLLAAARAPEAVATMLRRDPGRPQAGPARYFGNADLRRVTRIDDPGSVTAAEIERRLRAFGSVSISAGGRWWRATRLRPSRGGSGAFETRDGVRLEPDRLMHLPPRLHRLAERAGLL